MEGFILNEAFHRYSNFKFIILHRGFVQTIQGLNLAFYEQKENYQRPRLWVYTNTL